MLNNTFDIKTKKDTVTCLEYFHLLQSNNYSLSYFCRSEIGQNSCCQSCKKYELLTCVDKHIKCPSLEPYCSYGYLDNGLLIKNVCPRTCKTCQPDVIQCDNNPCQNGGLCESTNLALNTSYPFEFKCLCSSGFYGDLCELKNPCASNPCSIDSQCIQLSQNDYVCKEVLYGRLENQLDVTYEEDLASLFDSYLYRNVITVTKVNSKRSISTNAIDLSQISEEIFSKIKSIYFDISSITGNWTNENEVYYLWLSINWELINVPIDSIIEKPSNSEIIDLIEADLDYLISLTPDGYTLTINRDNIIITETTEILIGSVQTGGIINQTVCIIKQYEKYCEYKKIIIDEDGKTTVDDQYTLFSSTPTQTTSSTSTTTNNLNTTKTSSTTTNKLTTIKTSTTTKKASTTTTLTTLTRRTTTTTTTRRTSTTTTTARRTTTTTRRRTTTTRRRTTTTRRRTTTTTRRGTTTTTRRRTTTTTRRLTTIRR